MTSLLLKGKPTTVVIYYLHDSSKNYSNIKIKEKDLKREEVEEVFDVLPMPPLPPTTTKAKVITKPQKNNIKNGYKYEEIKVTATAYCPCAKCCGRGSPGITKTGRSAWLPGVAVDPRYIPLGSHIDIPGYNRNNNGSWVLCDDTGGKIKKNRIDVRFKTHEEAKRWGRQEIIIRVWSKE